MSFRGFALGLACALVGGQVAAGELALEFPDLRSAGEVSVAIFRSGPDWARRKDPAWAGVLPVEAGAARVVRTLPAGEYAVMAYHDRNANGRLDTLPVGLPTEPYGFSNNSRGMFGPPSWRAAVFRLPEAGGRQVIRLR